MFEEDMPLGAGMPAPKRARTENGSQREAEPLMDMQRDTEPLRERTSCLLCASAESLYCGRIGMPLARCTLGTGGLAIEQTGTDSGTRCLLAVAVDAQLV